MVRFYRITEIINYFTEMLLCRTIHQMRVNIIFDKVRATGIPKVDIRSAFTYHFRHWFTQTPIQTQFKEKLKRMFTTTRLLGLLLNAKKLRGMPVGENRN